jgi:hypothetical protein
LIRQISEIYRLNLDEDLAIVASDPTGAVCSYLTIAGYGPHRAGFRARDIPD